MIPKVTVWVHPINTKVHPTIPPGFRWAVVLGETGPMGPTVNAGWCPGHSEACVEGEMVGVAVAKALQAFGVAAEYVVRAIDYDPVPADTVQIGG